MNMKRVYTAVILCVILFFANGALAQQREIPEKLIYQGGVVSRSGASAIAAYSLEPQLELGYALTDAPYIVLGRETNWEVVISGGAQPYTCEVLLAWQSDLSMDPYEDYWTVPDWFDLKDSSFSYTFTQGGRYFWEFDLTDAAGQTLVFQTRIFETYSQADELDETTVAGKVNSIIASEITENMSDYQRARVLHDWLIYNANYDYTYTHYEAAGVLLHKVGVCDSYARAYLMLLTAAGLDAMVVTGQADNGSGWGNHAWNLVKIGGSWYHVDCTWDDPGSGGYEYHAYFCLSDENMAKDHRWNRPGEMVDDQGMFVPEAQGGVCETKEDTCDYDFTFATIEEYDAGFQALLDAGVRKNKIIGLYTGSQPYEEIDSDFSLWLEETGNALFEQGLICGWGAELRGDQYICSPQWYDSSEYLRIDETALILSEGDTAAIKPAECVPDADGFTWTSSDPGVAVVSSRYSEEDGLIAEVTGVAGGEAVITVTSSDGISDSVQVTVLPAFEPDFELTLNESETGISLNWNRVPGVTEYRVMCAMEGGEACLAVLTGNAVSLTEEQLPTNEQQEIWVLGLRVVGGETAVEHCSERLTYGCAHEVIVDPAVPATHRTTGLTEGAHCGVCGEVLLAQAEIPVADVPVTLLPESLKVIEAQAFENDAFICVVISDGCERLEDGAFAGCSALRFAEIPGSVTQIAEDAFAGCRQDMVIVTDPGSTAEEFALAQGLACVYR